MLNSLRLLLVFCLAASTSALVVAPATQNSIAGAELLVQEAGLCAWWRRLSALCATASVASQQLHPALPLAAICILGVWLSRSPSSGAHDSACIAREGHGSAGHAPSRRPPCSFGHAVRPVIAAARPLVGRPMMTDEVAAACQHSSCPQTHAWAAQKGWASGVPASLLALAPSMSATAFLVTRRTRSLRRSRRPRRRRRRSQSRRRRRLASSGERPRRKRRASSGLVPLPSAVSFCQCRVPSWRLLPTPALMPFRGFHHVDLIAWAIQVYHIPRHNTSPTLRSPLAVYPWVRRAPCRAEWAKVRPSQWCCQYAHHLIPVSENRVLRGIS